MLETFEKQEEKLKKELQRYRDSDPEYIAQLKTETQVYNYLYHFEVVWCGVLKYSKYFIYQAPI